MPSSKPRGFKHVSVHKMQLHFCRTMLNPRGFDQRTFNYVPKWLSVDTAPRETLSPRH